MNGPQIAIVHFAKCSYPSMKIRNSLSISKSQSLSTLKRSQIGFRTIRPDASHSVNFIHVEDLVARTGRHQQRYEDGCRLVAGCIPFKYRPCDENSDTKSEKIVEVLMISSPSGPGWLFPKGGWENDETVEEAAKREAIEEAGVRGELMELLGHYYFRSKTHQDEFSPEGTCKAAMFPLLVTEQLDSWPEENSRSRIWLTIPEASENCRHAWMKDALLNGFLTWHAEKFQNSERLPDQ